YRAARSDDGGVLCINDAGTLEVIETNQKLVPNERQTKFNSIHIKSTIVMFVHYYFNRINQQTY
ncbi:unnamed protein product, partial [Rotaria magnacalcarata]